jgi:hypothetical protein
MKKIIIFLLLISKFATSQTMPSAIQDAINAQCCGNSATSSIIYVDSVSSNSAGDSLIVFKNGVRYAYKYPSGGGASTDKVETQTLSQNGSNFTFVTKDTNNVTTTQSFTIPDFWRSSVAIPVVANTLPDGTNDTIEFIQHRNDVFFGSANGLVRAGQGAGNGASNTVFGTNALATNTTGSELVAIGWGSQSAKGATTSFATSVGYNALSKNTGNYSTAFGNRTLENNTSGQNLGFGPYALNVNTTGTQNTAVGFVSLRFNNGSNNNAFGWESLGANTSGSQNNAFGTFALLRNTTGGNNTAVGYQSQQSTTTGSHNNSLGWNMALNTTGSKNTAIGSQSLWNNVSGNESIAIGYGALFNATANSNIAIGSANGNRGAGGGIITGTENIAIGSQGTGPTSGFSPLSQMTTGAGNHNTCIGSGASYIEGSRNTTLGWNNADIGTANDNVFIGSRVMTGIGANWNGSQSQKIATNKNTFVGADINFKSTAKNAIGDANTALGFNASVDVASITNATALGANSVVDASNQMQLGSNALTQVRTFGVFTFQKTYSEASVPNNSLYVDSATGKLFFKDSAGVSNALY